MDWLLYGFLEKEVDRDLKGQLLWLVNGWTTATGGGAAVAFTPILMII